MHDDLLYDPIQGQGQGHECLKASQEESTVSPTSCLRYCSDIAHWRPTKLCTMFGRLLGWYTIYTFSGAVAPSLKKSLYVQVLRSHILTALLHGTPSAGISQTLRHSAEGATNIRQGGHHVGNLSTF